MIVFNCLVIKLFPLCSITSRPSQSKISALCFRDFLRLLIEFSVFSWNLIPKQLVLLLFELLRKQNVHFTCIIQYKKNYLFSEFKFRQIIIYEQINSFLLTASFYYYFRLPLAAEVTNSKKEQNA